MPSLDGPPKNATAAAPKPKPPPKPEPEPSINDMLLVRRKAIEDDDSDEGDWSASDSD